ncbi:HAD-IIA family hydrolase [Campylobacter novaezeelandiae]|uniref:HAD-IIA family hydrolase n=2 Tax=Campylobacter novaezeelandiae TaxID=2267891 RepID=A0A4Q9JVJ0_9BACT|nr:HAD-IIA family hydrolase [Campylobacter novaezeelandiae]MBK1963880.1 HAD-IIA family hydrolase [Campylobacter novaezeelandiae]QWU80656.1 HAD superfamily hydrolase, subfamily IIA [Campylobacter novaezeelandiae]TBR78369.1 HAD-IIA family hydrolase [Campylobacter novaezeelandiae]TBR79707.1 HAD-IIA family hydrolase [Campylobacter novaezeelandiae]TBR80319.1 HAD-IIA family hydrolase [Campylobacter novaezeelandiae]
MFFLDVQGTLLSDKDKSLISGAKELISYLNSNNMPYVVVTNNTKKLDFLSILKQKGLDIKDNAYIDPFYVLKDILKPCKIAAFGAREFLFSLENLGFELDFNHPEALLISSYDDFKFKDFANMIELIKKDIRVIAMHETSIYKKDNRLYPGVGSIMAMLKNATNFNYEVVGKPSLAFYKEALKLIQKQNEQINFEDICIVSDDFKGDLLEAKNLNMKCILVLSGKMSDTKGIDISLLDKIYPSVLELLGELKCKI